MRTGRVREAKAFYHRAIYGQWSADSTSMRTRARLELVALLARRHESRELLAELLPLEAIASGSLPPRQLGALPDARREGPGGRISEACLQRYRI